VKPEAGGSKPLSHPISLSRSEMQTEAVVKRVKPGYTGACAPLAQSVEQRPFKPLVPGSSPGGRTLCTASSMVEQLTLNQLVGGSSPPRCTKFRSPWLQENPHNHGLFRAIVACLPISH
jgi:hypothetical protein